MKKQLALLSVVLAALGLNAQSTLFTYQGRLNDGLNQAQGIFDFRFSIFDSTTNGSQIGNAITNAGTGVINGLFTATLDFGPGAFPGTDRWLEIGVRTNGAAVDFQALTPRQQVTATPYAIQAASAATAASANTAAVANSVNATNVVGTLSLAQIPAVVVTNGASSVALTGAFNGDGSGLTNLSATTISSGKLVDGVLSTNVPLLNGTNIFSGTNRFSNVVLATNLNNQLSGAFNGNGSGLTNLSATNISSGKLADGLLSANVALLNGTNVFSGTNRFSNIVVATNSNNQLSGAFTGNGVALTNLAATNLAGTVPDARLSANVALRAGGNAFSGAQQVTDTVLSGPQAVDQQVLITTAAAGSADNWQSFTAGTNGFLSAVSLKVGPPSGGGNSSPGTIRIYAGEGTGGTLMATQSVAWQPIFNAFQANTLTPPPLLQAGSQYTIRFTCPSSPVTWVSVNTANPYAGGRADASASWDYGFQTFMAPGATNAPILMVNPAGSSGNVGIGTNSPRPDSM